AIENGFYYDFDLPRTLIPEDLAILEDKMRKIINQKQKFVMKEEPGDKAVEFLKKVEQKYKVELAQELSAAGEKITFYENVLPDTGKAMFVDLCKGPHVEHTGQIGPIKLMKISGAYWRGSEKNPMLQRIYGTCWHTKEELHDYLQQIEEAKKRDHRKLGVQLGLFQFHDISPGSVFFLPKGTIVFNELVSFLRKEYTKRGYKEVITPLVYDKSLWEQSGHWEHYKENMFQVQMDDREASLKPMNCPSHMLIYKMDLRSYRDLPLRIADFAMLHRNEVRGALGGMTRVRKFCMDDAHLFVAENQLEDEIINCIDFVKYIYKEVFDFDYDVVLSTKPEKSMGTEGQWKNAENALEKALKKAGVEFTVNPGDGAFYGPKIDFRIKDSLKREWQCATVQVDFQMPLRFQLEYEGNDGKMHTPVVIHRAILGSLERFMAILIEHYAGALPVWLAPVQAIILPVSDKFNDYSREVGDSLEKGGIRYEIDMSNETLGKKIRNAELNKIPYMLVVGEKEVEAKKIAVRDYATKKQEVIEVKEFLSRF
ncbi:threonine--tRNA ligase, partial [Candidatus Peregrinibacteria bacterium]|nr:threonine--tRNA ligase [Candidatus Peregrinibacteria bacterium]